MQSSGDDDQTKKLQQLVEKLQQQRVRQDAEQQQAQQHGVCIQLEERAAVYSGRAKCGAALRYEEAPPDLRQRMAEASFKIAAAAAATAAAATIKIMFRVQRMKFIANQL